MEFRVKSQSGRREVHEDTEKVYAELRGLIMKTELNGITKE